GGVGGRDRRGGARAAVGARRRGRRRGRGGCPEPERAAPRERLARRGLLVRRVLAVGARAAGGVVVGVAVTVALRTLRTGGGEAEVVDHDGVRGAAGPRPVHGD